MIWLRLVAALCIVMVTFMSAAQACHTHSESSSLRHSSNHHQPVPEDNCPVCVAMHSALPSPQHLAVAPALDVQPFTQVAFDSLRTFRWRFELASRGPPASPSDLSL
jgi:hypothetical protein